MTSIGVYFDGFNVYYGGRKKFGRGAAGWRWYSPRAISKKTLEYALQQPFLKQNEEVFHLWSGGSIDRIVFCTARVSPTRSQQAANDQNVYLSALQDGNHIDHLELGKYVSRIKYAPLATKNSDGHPQVVTPTWPVMVQDSQNEHMSDATFLASYLHSEEKGSDVNVATHLLKDVFEQRISAAILISNDTDLKLPISVARSKVPVAVVNPSESRVHNDLLEGHDPSRDWYMTMPKSCFCESQMPPQVGKWRRPQGW